MSAWREQWLEGWVTVGSVSEYMESNGWKGG